ncbi:MAG TPA: HNH endonuclease signature motif containing protein, partial [Candidatus Limnocylindrales bacterium]|nr:HNH endonuclease signature motif containing protein [Candidatus Limnocylindrales bacterium]
WPGCERPASWCDAHHLVHWIDDGLTDLDNLVLLCRRHHRMVHEGGWQLIKTEEEKIIAIAPSSPFMGKSPPQAGDGAYGLTQRA